MANHGWALDFVHDMLSTGRTIRVLSVVDEVTRECLALEVDTVFASRRVTRTLDEIGARRGKPQSIRCDNGQELTSRHFLSWCLEQQIELVHIQPGKPTQNAQVKSFHGASCAKSAYESAGFSNLFGARRKIGESRRDYNEQRPHSSLIYQTPAELVAMEKTRTASAWKTPWAVSHFPTAATTARVI